MAVLLPGTVTSGGKNDSSEILEVKKSFARCQSIRGLANTGRVSLFRVAKNATEIGRWKRSSPAGDSEVAYGTMTIFVADRKIQAADLYEETPSGDWYQTTSYCFRLDGTLSFVLSKLRTFHGNVNVEDRLYFNRKGKNIRSLRHVYDLETNKRVNAEERGFMSRSPHLFMSTKGIINEVGRENVFP